MFKIFETKSSFVLLEDGMTHHVDCPIFEFKLSRDMTKHYSTEFPQYELIFKTGGAFGFNEYFTLNFRGVDFDPKCDGLQVKMFVLNLLNKFKQGDYEKILFELFKTSCSAEFFEKYYKIVQKKNIKVKMLETQIKDLKMRINELELNNSALAKLNEENDLLKMKINKIIEIVQ